MNNIAVSTDVEVFVWMCVSHIYMADIAGMANVYLVV
jgi:hypothetical protein